MQLEFDEQIEHVLRQGEHICNKRCEVEGDNK